MNRNNIQNITKSVPPKQPMLFTILEYAIKAAVICLVVLFVYGYFAIDDLYHPKSKPTAAKFEH